MMRFMLSFADTVCRAIRGKYDKARYIIMIIRIWQRVEVS